MFCSTSIGLKHTAFLKHAVSFLKLETCILAMKGVVGMQTRENTTNLRNSWGPKEKTQKLWIACASHSQGFWLLGQSQCKFHESVMHIK